MFPPAPPPDLVVVPAHPDPCAAEQPRATGAPAHTSPGTGAARAAAARSSVETQRELRAIVAPASELSDAIPPSLSLGGVRGVA